MARSLAAAVLILAASALPALADDAPPAPQSPAARPAPANPEVDRRGALDELLGRLSKTDDPRSAKRIAGAVQALWLRSGSETIDLLTARAGEAQRGQKLDAAIKLMDEVVSLRPDFAEGWNRRATLNFAAKDYDAAMADIHQTLVREPRHFGAWLALGRILASSGFDKQALAAFRKTLEIYPAVEGLKKETDELALKVEGQPI